MKIILGIVVGLAMSVGIYAYAVPQEVKYTVDNGIEFLRGSFRAGEVLIDSFLDHKTGATCYVVRQGWHSAGISCVK